MSKKMEEKEEIKKEQKKTNKKQTKKTNTKKNNTPKEEKTTKTNETEKTEFKKAEKKEQKKYNKKEKTKKPKKIIGVVVISAIIGIAIILSSIFAILNMNNEKILNGITIEGIDVSKLSKEEAKNKIEQIYADKISKEIEIEYQDYESAIDLNLIETKYDVEKAVEEAIQTGRGKNIFTDNYEIIKTYLMKKDIKVEHTINEDIAKQTIEDIGTKLPGIVVESSYYIEDDNLIIGKGKTGIAINSDEMLNKIQNELNKTEKTQERIEIPVINKEPEPINLEKIHEEVHKEVQDAYYTKNPFEIHPEVEGIDFDIEKAKTILEEEGKEEYIIPLIITKPKVTLSQIGTEAFPDKLATFTTKYDATNTDRTTNLKIACQKINGKVILSGETFSYNQTLGKRTAEAGYRNGKIYENGQVVDGIGGGICQISSTLYNTVLMANLEIVERRNHQFVTSYLPAGRDATVVYGATDFKFKNTRKYPVRIVANVSNGIATVTMYGIKEEEEYTVSFSTKTISTIPPTTTYEEDPSLPTGTEKIKQAGSNGLVTETYITKKLNGKVVSTKLLSRDTYSAMAKIITRGTGKATTPTTIEPQPTTPQQEPTQPIPSTVPTTPKPVETPSAPQQEIPDNEEE